MRAISRMFCFHYRTENFVKASQLFFFVEEKRKDCDEMNAWMDDMLSSKVSFTPCFNKLIVCEDK